MIIDNWLVGLMENVSMSAVVFSRESEEVLLGRIQASVT